MLQNIGKSFLKCIWRCRNSSQRVRDDRSTVEMKHANNPDPATQQQIVQTLRLPREYRRAYPRKTQAVMGEADELKQYRKTTQEAEEYLEHIR